MMMRLSLLQQAIVSSGRVFTLLDSEELAAKQLGDEEPEINIGSIEFKKCKFFLRWET